MERKIDLIGAACGLGSKDPGAGNGPEMLFMEKDLSALLENRGLAIENMDILFCEEIPIDAFKEKLAHVVEKSLIEEHFPVVIGGSRCVSEGTWRGANHFIQKENKDLGLLWIDAHRCPPNYKGQHINSLSGLLGSDLDPLNLCLVSLEEMKTKGFQKILQEAVQYLNNRTGAFGVSLNMNVFEPSSASFPLTQEESIQSLGFLKSEENFVILEIVECNLLRRIGENIEKFIPDLITCMLEEMPWEKQKKLYA
ncbi:MAG: hypothetical protein Tsb0015_02010 [Simkaniaceae bacterium]